MTNLWKYREILLDSLLELYNTTKDEKERQGIYDARGIVYRSQATLKWIEENKSNDR